MTGIVKSLSIVKARWPEVILIIGLYSLADISYSLFNFEQPNVINMITLFFVFSLIIISTILNYGFLRTAHLEGSKKQMPIDLLKTGKHFFWRMVGFSLIYIIPYMTSAWIIFSIIKYFTPIDTGFLESSDSNPLIYNLCFVVTMLILIKITLYIPAFIFVLDCRVIESFNFLNKFKLSESKEIVILYFISTVMLLLEALLKIPNNAETILQHILRTGINIIQQLLWLIIAVMAVRFVGSLNLVYDSSRKNLDSEDMIENKTED